MKTFSNRYMFIYALGVSLVVAVVLTLVSVSLKPLQTRNQEAEQKQMILKAIGVESSRDDAAELFAQYIKEVNGFYLFDGGTVVPMHGSGLWGPIWGYLALDESSTVVGAVFDHKGETPGLGGEIASEKFASQFKGKQLPLSLKKNADPKSRYEVDAISGGTMTSNGVTAMLQKAYEDYCSLGGQTASTNGKEAIE